MRNDNISLLTFSVKYHRSYILGTGEVYLKNYYFLLKLGNNDLNLINL